MCKVIRIKLEKKLTAIECDKIKKQGENLGFRLSVYNQTIELVGYNNCCFCTPKEGWRKAAQKLIHDLIGEEYYIHFPMATDMYVTKGKMPIEIKQKIEKAIEDLQNELNQVASHPDIDDVDIKSLEDVIINYKGCKRRYDTGNIYEVDF